MPTPLVWANWRGGGDPSTLHIQILPIHHDNQCHTQMIHACVVCEWTQMRGYWKKRDCRSVTNEILFDCWPDRQTNDGSPLCPYWGVLNLPILNHQTNLEQNCLNVKMTSGLSVRVLFLSSLADIWNLLNDCVWQLLQMKIAFYNKVSFSQCSLNPMGT